MEGREIIRRSLTLSDHMSTPARDGSALKLREEEEGRRASRSITLGSAIASEKREAFAARGAFGASSSRTLMDIIREKQPVGRGEFDPATSAAAASINWRSFKNRLQIQPDGDDVNVLPTSPVFSRSVSVRRNEMRVPAAPPVEPPSAAAGGGETAPSSAGARAEEQPVRMSLMALLEQTDGRGDEEDDDDEVEEEEEEEAEEEREGRGMHYVCCVCMVRHKGAAFIPCGHTFCRLCSRELWVSRGNCPLCNGYILEILDIF